MEWAGEGSGRAEDGCGCGGPCRDSEQGGVSEREGTSAHLDRARDQDRSSEQALVGRKGHRRTEQETKGTEGCVLLVDLLDIWNERHGVL